SGPPTSWTVWLGDPGGMAGRAERALARFRRLKLKLGGRDGLDVERVRAVRAVAGGLPLQVDVNEAWSLEEAIESLPPLAELGVEYCEQPLSAGDPGGPELKERSPRGICCSLRASRETRTTGRRCAASSATGGTTSSRSSTRRAPGRRRTVCRSSAASPTRSRSARRPRWSGLRRRAGASRRSG